jgi:hypothetical protein
MTLMLRPEVWRKMYSASAMGAYLPTGDPTLEPRWLMMMAGGLFISGLWLIYLSGRSTFTVKERSFVADLGGKVAAVFGFLYLAAGLWAAIAQPAIVKALLASPPAGYEFYKYFVIASYGWLALVICAVMVAAAIGFGKFADAQTILPSWVAVLLAVLIEIMFTIYRDGVRDLTLLASGYNVWDRAVETNWWVVGLFLILFVAGLGMIAWLISVVARSKKVMEGAA